MRRPLACSLTSLILACSSQPPPNGQTDDPSGTSTSSGDGTDSEGASSVDPSTDSSGSEDDGSTGDGPAESSDPYHRGDRLHPVVRRNSAGEERLEFWHDPQLEMDCYFGELESGEFACIPTHVWANNVFADPQCSRPASREDPCSDTPRYGRHSLGWCSDSEVWERGRPVATIYHLDGDGNCAPRPDAEGYALEPVAATTFVRATRSLRAVDDALGRWEFEADDGSTQWVGPLVLDRQEFCNPIQVQGTTVCLDNRTASTGLDLHQDAACAGNDVAYAVGQHLCPEPPRFARGPEGELSTLTGPLDSGALWRGSEASSCVPLLDSDTSLDYDTYAFETFKPSDAPSVSLERHGRDRLRLQTPRSLEGPPVSGPLYPWFDDEFGVECRPSSDDFGPDRCIPGTQWSTNFFSDSTCSTPLVRDFFGDGWVTLAEYVVDARTCVTTRILGAGQTGDPYDGDVYQRAEGRCEQLEDPTPWGPLRRFSTYHEARALPSLERVRL